MACSLNTEKIKPNCFIHTPQFIPPGRNNIYLCYHHSLSSIYLSYNPLSPQKNHSYQVQRKNTGEKKIMKKKKSKFKEEKNIRYKSRLKINLNLNLVNSQVCPKMLVGRPLSNPINSGSWPIPLSKLATNHSANCQIPLSKQAGHASPSTD